MSKKKTNTVNIKDFKPKAYRGGTNDAPVTMPHRDTKIKVGNTVFTDIYAAGAAHGVPLTTMISRLQAGVVGKDLLKSHLTSRTVTIKGVTYESISEAVRKTPYKETTIRRHMDEKGVFDPDGVTDNTFEFDGKTYPDGLTVSKMLGVPNTTFRRWKALDLSDQEIMDRAYKSNLRKKAKERDDK